MHLPCCHQCAHDSSSHDQWSVCVYVWLLLMLLFLLLMLFVLDYRLCHEISLLCQDDDVDDDHYNVVVAVDNYSTAEEVFSHWFV